jgi:hypothetical protein
VKNPPSFECGGAENSERRFSTSVSSVEIKINKAILKRAVYKRSLLKQRKHKSASVNLKLLK